MTTGLLLANFCTGQEIRWNDTHSLINNDLALKMQIEDKHKLARMAVQNFEQMLSWGLVSRSKCKIYKIENYVDFSEYIYGFWDIEYNVYKPGSYRASRETLANEQIESSWKHILTLIDLNRSMSSHSQYDKESARDMIEDYFKNLTSWQFVRDCSPSVRLTLPLKIKFVEKYLQIN